MDMQKLFDLIDRSTDTSSTLRQPNVNELIDWIKGSGMAVEIYRDEKVEKLIDALRNSVYSTMSERRAMVTEVLRSIVGCVCEGQGIDLVYRYPNIERTLIIGCVNRGTYIGFGPVYGIRDCDPYGSDQPVWEYLTVDAKYSLINAIAFRYRDMRRRSHYGVHDVMELHKPVTDYLGDF